MSDHVLSLDPERQMMLDVMSQGTLYYRDIDQLTHRRLDALMRQIPYAPAAYVLFTLTYSAGRGDQHSLDDQVRVLNVACQPCPVEKVLQILNSGEITLTAQDDSGKYEAILCMYEDYQRQTAHVEWWSALQRGAV